MPVLRRLAIFGRRWASRLTAPRFIVRERAGAVFLLDQMNLVDRHLNERGEWEPEQLELLRTLTTAQRPSCNRATFLDIGAHGGYYAIQMARTGLFDRIVCIEADVVNAGQLHANLFLNGLARSVEVVHAAASDKPGTLRLKPGPSRNRGATSVGETQGGETGIDTPAITIDQLGIGAGGLVVAKIDVEGAELAVLAGMQDVLCSNTCILQVESFGDNIQRVAEFILSRGGEWMATVDADHVFRLDGADGRPA